VTKLQKDGIPDHLYAKCESEFGDVMTSKLIMAATVINAWNRIGVGFKLQPQF
jgi:hypothetical protein